jgi:hypothetical protein
MLQNIILISICFSIIYFLFGNNFLNIDSMLDLSDITSNIRIVAIFLNVAL